MRRASSPVHTLQLVTETGDVEVEYALEDLVLLAVKGERIRWWCVCGGGDGTD